MPLKKITPPDIEEFHFDTGLRTPRGTLEFLRLLIWLASNGVEVTIFNDGYADWKTPNPQAKRPGCWIDREKSGNGSGVLIVQADGTYRYDH